MKSFPKHFIVVIALFALVAAVGIGLWLWTGSRLSAAVEEKTSLQGQLSSISSRGIFPSSQNLAKIDAQVAAMSEITSPVMSAMKETSKLFESVRGDADGKGSFKGLGGNEWKRLLGEQRNALLTLADQNKVTLPEGFYLGFSRYRALNPAESATYPLGVQLVALNELCRILIESKVTTFDEPKRVMVEDTGTTMPNAGGLAAQVTDGPGGLYRIYPFEISFTSEAPTVFAVVNAVAASPYFFVIRSVEVDNEKTTVPRRAEVVSAKSSENTPSNAQKLIVPVAGQEKVKCVLRVDLLLWSGSDAPPVEGGAKP